MILLLSDLHLPKKPSPLREGFLRLLAGPAQQAQSVYILGDLFEYWVGDDLGLTDYADEVAALRALTQSGVRVYFIAGNRDFLVGKTFFAASGVEALRDPSIVTLAGVPSLLSHGDLFCTDDRAYQRWRRFSRSRLWQRAFAMLPQEWRIGIAGGLRKQSGDAKQTKSASIMDVNAEAVRDALKAQRVKRLIHGHTHRPAHHRIDIDRHTAERIVLPDWHGAQMDYLEIAADGSVTQRRITL